jgi:hypothetical protein
MKKYDIMRKLDDNEKFNMGKLNILDVKIYTEKMILWHSVMGEHKVKGYKLKLEDLNGKGVISGIKKTYYTNFFKR